MKLRATVHGEWAAARHGGEWVIAHAPTGVVFGTLPGRAYASAAHALRTLAALPPAPTPSRVEDCLTLALGYEPDRPVAEHSATYVWTEMAATALRRVQAKAWGDGPAEGAPVEVA